MELYTMSMDSKSDAALVRNFMYQVYAWMSSALAISGIIAYAVGSQPAIAMRIVQNPWLFLGIVVAQVAVAFVLSTRVLRLEYPAVVALFIGYAALTGLMLSTLFLVYTTASLYQTFFVTAGMFLLMALYGYYTRSDLSSLGSFLVMGLFGLLIAMVVNLFWRNTTFDLVISAIGVLIFVGLTAFDVQRIKQIGQQLLGERQALSKVALRAALVLYLDFLNLFLFLLRFTGRQRE